jgi:hypothetical protein
MPRKIVTSNEIETLYGDRTSGRHRKRLIDQGLFPRPFKMGVGNDKSRNAWWADELDAHYARLAARRNQALPSTETSSAPAVIVPIVEGKR